MVRADDCTQCGEPIEPETLKQTGTLCFKCRETNARGVRLSWCVAPMHKSNYILITDKKDLTGLNNKGGLVK